MTDLDLGVSFGGYEIREVLGRGAMGVVYRAYDARLDREVALKVVAAHLAQDPEFRGRFAQEARSAARVENPGVIAIYESGEVEETPFLAMRLIRGRELSEILKDRGRISREEALRILEPIARGLDAAHQAGIVHRDVKPANILVPDDGTPAVLVDFGIGRVMQGTRATQTGAWVGTVDYVAPEQIRGGDVDGRADQYALACVLYEMLEGVPPFRRDDAIQSLFAHANDTPPAVSTGSPESDATASAAIARAMSKAPGERFSTCESFLGAVRSASSASSDSAATSSLVGARSGTVIAADSPPAAAIPSKFDVREERGAGPAGSRRRRVGFAVGAALLVVVVAGVVIAFMMRQGSGEASPGAVSPATAAPTSSEPATTAIDPALLALRASVSKYRVRYETYTSEYRQRWNAARREWKACDSSGDSECTWETWIQFASWNVRVNNGLAALLRKATEQSAAMGVCPTGFDKALQYHVKMALLYQESVNAMKARDNDRSSAVDKRINNAITFIMLDCNP